MRFRSAYCWTCGKPRGNPAAHVCTGSDFAKRRAAQKRADAAAARKKKTAERRAKVNARIKAVRVRERAKADARVARVRAKMKPAAGRPHRYESCKDGDCQRLACQAFRDGVEEGIALAAGSKS